MAAKSARGWVSLTQAGLAGRDETGFNEIFGRAANNYGYMGALELATKAIYPKDKLRAEERVQGRELVTPFAKEKFVWTGDSFETVLPKKGEKTKDRKYVEEFRDWKKSLPASVELRRDRPR
jgi:hypothetical protein